MNNKSLSYKYLLAVSIPLLILLFLAACPLFILLVGQDITLETKPYDPRDLFRGDYVGLNYKIEDVSIDKFPEEVRNSRQDNYLYYSYYDFSSAKNGMYAVLKKNGNVYDIDYISFERPKNKIYLKCKINVYDYRYVYDNNGVVSVNYFGLDKYFVPENTGTKLEEASRKGELLAKIKVWNGYAVLTKLEPIVPNTKDE